MNHATISLTQLVNNAKNHLELLGYAESTKQRYIIQWNHFLMYAGQKGWNHFSKKIGNYFLEFYYGIKAGRDLSNDQIFKVRTITVLGEILEHNCFLRCHQKPGANKPRQNLKAF